MSFNILYHCRFCGKDMTEEYRSADCKDNVCGDCQHKNFKSGESDFLEKQLREIKEKKKTVQERLVEQLAYACKMAYEKHHKGNEDIGWAELGDVLLDALEGYRAGYAREEFKK